MATDYEKVCPACGTAAPLASKFCQGCGHEYRTVFHEQSEPVLAMSAPSGAVDMNWVPLATVIPVLIVLLLFASNRQPASIPAVPPTQIILQTPTTPATVQTLPAQYVSNVPQAGLLAYGQSTADVLRLIGSPQRRENINNGGPEQNWYYTQGGRTLQVHFNHSGQVDSYTTY